MHKLIYYWPIEPNRGFIEDNHNSSPTFSLEMKLNGIDCTFELYCDSEGAPWFAKALISNFDLGNPLSIMPIISMLPEHLRSVLTLSYRPDIQYLPFELFDIQVNNNPKPFKRNFVESKPKLSIENTKNLFAISLEFREDLELFAEGFNEKIPIKYRYLSLYKLYERFYPNESEQKEFLKLFEEDAKKLNLSKSLYAELFDFRNKCAHGLVGKSKRIKKGFSSLNAADNRMLITLMPILLKIAAKIMNEISSGKCNFPEECYKRFVANA